MAEESRGGALLVICFMTLWCGSAFWMTYFTLQTGAPSVLTFFSFMFGLFGLLFCIACFKKPGEPLDIEEPRAAIYRLQEPPIIPVESEDLEPSPMKREKSVYQAPSKCTSCGASISSESVDWVGPLQIQCPYCNATIDAEERIL